MKSGYIRIRINNAYVYEHRYVMEKLLGRPLHRLESVHHLNGNKADNRRANLQLRNKRDHDRLETSHRWKVDPDSFRSKCHCPIAEK